MRLLYLVLLIFCLFDGAVAQISGDAGIRVPADATAPEDAAFNVAYAARGIPVVTGKLLNVSTDEQRGMTIKYTLVTPFLQLWLTKIALVRPDGSFSLQMDNALPYQQIWFDIKDVFYTGLYANKDLFLELDMSKLKAAKKVYFNGVGVRYLGTDGPLNTYLNNYLLYKPLERVALSVKASKLLPIPPSDSLLAAVREIFDSLKKIQNSYIAANPSPYGWILENERVSQYYEQVVAKYWYKTMDDSLWQKIRQHKSYLISNDGSLFYNYLVTYICTMPGPQQVTGWKDVAGDQDLDAGEKALIDSLRAGEKMQPGPPYTPDNIKKWTTQLQPRIQKLALLRNLDKNVRRLDSLFPPAKADFLKLRQNAGESLSDQQLAFRHILNSIHTDWCLTILNGEYDRLTARVNEVNQALANSAAIRTDSGFGRPLIRTSFGASLYDATGMKALDLLASLRQAFPGKALIIDRWATWCAPCLGEMPHSKELQQESADLPVVFVYLCTTNNSTEQKWKQKVAELEQPGIHILIDETLDADLSTYFSFNGYPGYALIDQTGKYRPGAISFMSQIKDKDALQALLK
jgi:thiol-disulfide isomerase/thioredoxin